MFTAYTYQDYLQSDNKQAFLLEAVRAYKGSADFLHALTASAYFNGENEKVGGKVILKAQDVETQKNGQTVKRITTKDVEGNRIGNSFFFRFVVQECQYLLSNGVILDEEVNKGKLGTGFDRKLEELGEQALVQGVAWGFFNLDHLEIIRAAKDRLSGFFALADEMTGAPRIGVQFWQIKSDKPMGLRVFEEDGYAVYSVYEGAYSTIEPKRGYKQIVHTDALGSDVVGEENWNALPVIPLYGNPEKVSELTPAIKQKIDAYDNIISDFADNLDRANDVYWVLNNFGGTTDEIAETLAAINRIKAVVNRSDGMGNASTAEPHTIDVPYAARQSALELLHKALYADYMALDMDALTGGSLTNVAIDAAKANLDLKTNRFEWMVFDFVRSILHLIGVDTDAIRFQRQTISNTSETVQAIYMMRSDLDIATALRLNPLVQPEEIEDIIANREAEQTTGMPSMEELQAAIDAAGGDGA